MFAIPIFDTRRFFDPASANAPLTIAASSCLTGAAVRYDGASKTLPLLQTLSANGIRILPICPEVGAGLDVPRPPVQLVARAGEPPRARGRELKSLDVTSALEQFAHASLRQMQSETTLCGYLWKSRSPSCGLGSTPLFSPAGTQIGRTSGIQALHVSTALPWLAHVEESALDSPSNAARFLLQCRWVFDLRSTLARDTSAFADWHRHYACLWQLLPAQVSANLQRCVDGGDWQNYLALLHRACGNEEAEQLLGLFAVGAG